VKLITVLLLLYSKLKPIKRFNKTGSVCKQDVMTCLCNQCSNGNMAVHFVCTVEIFVTLNKITIFGVAQKFFYGEFLLLATVKHT